MSIITCDNRNFKLTYKECEGVIHHACTRGVPHCPFGVIVPFVKDGDNYEFTIPDWFEHGVYDVVIGVKNKYRECKSFIVKVFVEGARPHDEHSYTPTPGAWDGSVIKECCEESNP